MRGTQYLIEVDVQAFQLQVGGAIVAASRSAFKVFPFVPSIHVHAGAVKAVLARDGLPVALLACRCDGDGLA